MNIVLIEPEIPQNAGNIVRTCAITGANLYMVKPLGFEVSDKHFKRAGLDYRDFANVKIVDSFEELYEENKDKPFYFASTKSAKTYVDVNYTEDCFIVFGRSNFFVVSIFFIHNAGFFCFCSVVYLCFFCSFFC